MSLQLQHHLDYSPPSYSQANSQPLSHFDSLKLPSVPAGDILPRISHRLPTLEPAPSLSLSTAPPHPYHIKSDPDAQKNPDLYPSARMQLAPLQLPIIPSKLPPDLSSPTDAASVMSIDDSRFRDGSVSMDDPNDRMAAEALCGLGKVETTQPSRSQSGYETPLQYYPLGPEHALSGANNHGPEPLLSLLTSSHPWLGGTIHNSLSAYSSTKSYSPRFIQYSADFVERNIGSPMANTVGSVGRRTGVEGSIRRYLGERNSIDADRGEISAEEGAKKRRRISSREDDAMDIEQGAPLHKANSIRHVSMLSSVDSLPPYDENRSPSYEDSQALVETSRRVDKPRSQQRQLRPPVNRSWSTQLIISTSGLGAALNDASLRSLKYCLNLLRSANAHTRFLMESLKKLLKEHDHSSRRLEEGDRTADDSEKDAQHVEHAMLVDGRQCEHREAERESIARRIKSLNDEIWDTLKNVVSNVSRYTGGALPENASVVVRWQLMSVPQRWHRAVAAQQQPENTRPSQPDAISSAHRMLAFAIEGLDMMEQVGGVVDSTISSAESWLESMGRKKQEDERVENNAAQDFQVQEQDVKMSVEVSGAETTTP